MTQEIKALPKKAKKYIVLSPDGFNINHEIYYYRSLKAATADLLKFIEKYRVQGYYSTSNRERLTLEELPHYCTCKQIN